MVAWIPVLWTPALLFTARNLSTLIQERPGLYREVLHLPGPRRRHPLHGAKDKANDLEVARQRHYLFSTLLVSAHRAWLKIVHDVLDDVEPPVEPLTDKVRSNFLYLTTESCAPAIPGHHAKENGRWFPASQRGNP